MKLYQQLILSVFTIVIVFAPFDVDARGRAQSLDITPLKIETDSGSYSFDVELAVSQKEHSIGLMYRHQMPDNHGMLFLNHEVRYNSFWMKNTYISLDIIFVRANGSVANIVAGTVPLSLDPVLSTEPVLAVLELNAGQAARIGLKAGDMVYHHIFGNTQ